MADIMFQLINFTCELNQPNHHNIEWLSENDSEKLNEHLVLAGQKPMEDEQYRDLSRKGVARYCLLYDNGVPVARGAVEPYSEDAWEAADIRTAREYRGRGFAKEVLRFLSREILAHKKIATCRTEKNNIPMQRALQSIGYSLRG